MKIKSKRKLVENISIGNQHTVFVDDVQVFLTVKRFDLLILLVKNHGNVLTEQLLESIWEVSTELKVELLMFT